VKGAIVPNAAFENLAKDQTGLFEVPLFEHDLPDGVIFNI
jgi:hypothetical protein